nr:hypothetical protein [Candidatus Sigynarchaeota archaeon]
MMERLRAAIQEEGYASILTHNDPDGIVAAAITIRALQKMGLSNDEIDVIFESPSSIQNDRSRFLDPDEQDFVGGFIIIIDLPLHQLARVWIDHHALEAKDATVLESIEFHLHDTSSSAAVLARQFFNEKLGIKGSLCNPQLLEFVNARDIGLAPTVANKDFETLSMAIHEDRTDYDFFLDIIDLLAKSDDTKWIVTDAKIQTKAKHQKKRVNRGVMQVETLIPSTDEISFFKAIDIESEKDPSDETKHRVFLLDDRLLFLDFSDIDNPDKERRYGISIPYYTVEPALKKGGHDYKGMLTYRGDDKTGDIHCTISINQSKEDLVQNVDVSGFARQYGGGGHRFVSGFIIGPDRFMKVIKATIAFFKQNR